MEDKNAILNLEEPHIFDYQGSSTNNLHTEGTMSFGIPFPPINQLTTSDFQNDNTDYKQFYLTALNEASQKYECQL